MAFSLFKKSEPDTPAPPATADVPVVDAVLDEPTPAPVAAPADEETPAAEQTLILRPLGGATAARIAFPDFAVDDLDAAAGRLSGAQQTDANTHAAEDVAAEDAQAEDVPAEETTAPQAAIAEDSQLNEAELLAALQARDAAAAANAQGAVEGDPVSAEQARLERERAARREARKAALAPVEEEDPLQAAPVAAPPVTVVKRTTDRFWGSLGLFLLRAVTAAILFVHGLNGVINPRPVLEIWSNTILPYPRYIALGVSWLQLALALLILFGLLTRLSGLALAGLMGVTLAFVMWGSWSIFEPGGMGFIGEEQLLLAAVGLVLLVLGAGSWSFDYALRRHHDREGLGQ